MKSHNRSTLEVIREVIDIEADAIRSLSSQIGPEIDLLVNEILNSSGKVVVCGMGKSGLIGQKISATLSSTGTSSFFLHPGEAFHGDLGALERKDILLLLSYSGKTEEVVRILPYAKDKGLMTASITGKPDSLLAQNCHFHINASVKAEACPLQLAPTSSTTAALVVGDALALALMEKRGFKEEDFAKYHPGGSLGQRLLLTAQDTMIPAKEMPVARISDTAIDIVDKMAVGRVGLVVVCNEELKVEGVISAGDLIRALRLVPDVTNISVNDILTRNPVTCRASDTLNVVLTVMREQQITSVVVVDNALRLEGVVHQKASE